MNMRQVMSPIIIKKHLNNDAIEKRNCWHNEKILFFWLPNEHIEFFATIKSKIKSCFEISESSFALGVSLFL